jgi:hypothetical protein
LCLLALPDSVRVAKGGGMSLRFRLLVLAGVLFVLIGLPFGFLWWMTSVPGQSFHGPLPPLSREGKQAAERLRADVSAIAASPRNVAHSAALDHAARYVERSLAGQGYAVELQPFRAGGAMVRNIEAVIEPKQAAAPTMVIGAHYDSWGDSPGANDNGSGTAAILELARRLVDLRGKSALRIRLVLFVNEEPPFFQTEHMGSLVYARRLKARGEAVLGMLSLETMGFYSERDGSQHYPWPLGLFYPRDGDFIAFVGPISSRRFLRQAVGEFRRAANFPSIGGVAPTAMQGIGWSDHWAFDRVGIPAAMVTDTAPFRYPHYHAASDTPDKLDYERLARVVAGLEAMVRAWAAHPPR